MFKTSELEELFKENYDALCMFSMHYVEGFEAAEDIVMDSFSKLYEKVSAGEKIVSPKLYLYQMTKNASIDYIRKKKDSNRVELESVCLETDDWDETVDRSEREARLWREIDRLPPVRKKVLLMSKRDGMKHEEIAKVLGISVKTVESHIYKAYNALRAKAKNIYAMLFL